MYSTIDNVKKSFELAWENKILWVFALFVAVSVPTLSLTGGTDDDDKPSRRRDYDFESTSVMENPVLAALPNLPNTFVINENVLGESIIGAPSGVVPMQDPFQDPLREISSSFFDMMAKSFFVWVIIGSLYFALLIYMMFVNMINRAWGSGALTKQTLNTIENQEKPTLGGMASYGIKYLKKIVILDLIIFGIILVLMAIPTLSFLPLIISEEIYLVALPIFGVFIFIIAVAMIGFIRMFAVREVVSGNTPWESFKAGWKMLQVNFWKAFALTFVNAFIGVLGLVAIILGIGVSLITIILIPFVIILLPQAVNGFLTTYTSFAWSHLYFHARSE